VERLARSFVFLVMVAPAACGRIGYELLGASRDGALIDGAIDASAIDASAIDGARIDAARDGAMVDGTVPAGDLCQRAWSPISQLSTGNAALTLSLGMRDGEAIAAFAQPAGGALGAFVGEHRGVWDSVRRVDALDANVEAPVIAIAQSGDAVAFWVQEETASTRFAWAARRSASGVWSAPERLVAGASNYAYGVTASIDDDGNALIAWGSGFEKSVDTHIYVSRARPGESWSAPLRLDAMALEAFFPLSVADEIGGALVVWIQVSRFYWSRFSAGAWSAPVAIADVRPSDVALTGFADGSAVLAWSEMVSPDGQEIRVAEFSPATGWTAPVAIDDDPTGLKQVALAAREPGEVWLAWTQFFVDARPSTLFVTARSGGVWSDVSALIGPTSDGLSRAAIAAGSPGVMIAWQQRLTSSDVWTACFDDEDGWRAPMLMELASEDALPPELAIDELGQATLSWLQFNPGGVMSVYARTTEP
jgi:hypothetical protein